MNEIIKPEHKEVITTEETWGAAEDTELRDILIPRILLQQKMSKFVEEEKAKPGQFVDSVDATVLGTAEKPLEAIIFHAFKNFMVLNADDGSFVRIEDFREGAEEQFNENGVSLNRYKSYNFYCLLPQENIDLASPFLLSFSRTASRAAKQLHTIFSRLRRLGKPSAAVVVKFGIVKRSNERGTWYLPDPSVARNATDQEIWAAKSWYNEIKSGAVEVKIHESPKEQELALYENRGSDDEIPF